MLKNNPNVVDKDSFLLELHDAQMAAVDPEKRILYQLLKEVGTRWAEILHDGISAERPGDDRKEFYANFVGATVRLMQWMTVTSIKPYVSNQHVQGGVDAILRDLRAGVNASVKTLLAEDEEAEHAEQSHRESV
jgi:hypothetical protein